MKRRAFLAAVGSGFVGTTLARHAFAAERARAACAFLLSSAGCGRATGYAEASKIVTVGDRTHVAWLEATPDGFRVCIRTLDRRRGDWSPTEIVGGAQDNHGGPGLTVDSKGFLHLLYGPHHEPFRYRRSQRPNDASAWEPEIRFGDELSYPVLLCAPDDRLLMTTRRSHGDKVKDKVTPWEVELWRKPADGPWRRDRVLLRSRFGDYAHFQESLAWGPDHRTIHLACRIYETTSRPGEAPLETLGYLISPDSGRTWHRGDGAPVSLPATAESVDVLAAGGGATKRTLYSGSIAVDRRGVAHQLYSLRENGAAHSFLVTRRPGERPSRRDLNASLPERFRDWDLVMPGGMTFSASGRATIVATLAKPGTGESDWAHATNEVVRFWSDDDTRTFRSEVLGPVDPATPHWLPNLERPTGHHAIPDEPGIIFQSGGGGDGLNELTLNNGVWWRPTGG